MAIIRGTKLSDLLSGTSEADKLYGLAGDDTIAGGDGNDILSGGGGNDSMTGGNGADKVNGGGGDDELSGGDDNDSIIGGGGNDTAYGGSSNDKITGGGGNDTLRGGDDIDIIKGDNGDDAIYGDDGDDLLYGVSGIDTIYGGNGDDYINGGIGDDTVNGGAGNDRLYGINDNDTINGDAGADVINGGIGDDTVSGGADDDIVIGEVGHDSVYGDAGDDALYGGFGNDDLYGGEGDDYAFGDTDNDHVYGENGNDTLLGGDGNDTVEGGAGNDSLDGGEGTDTLIGGSGNDTLSGWLGQDTAAFSGDADEYDFVFIGTDIIVKHVRGDATDGNDTVRANVEWFQFANGTFARPSAGADGYDVSTPTDSNSDTNTVSEGATIGTAVGLTASSVDLDITNNTITYSLTDSAGGLFQIDAETGIVTTAAAINAETAGLSKTIVVQAASSDGSVATETFTIAIGDIDEFDVGTLSDTNSAANAVAEGAAVGTAVGITARATDADASNNAITYSLTNDAGGRFQIDASTGIVSVAGGIDRETDGASLSITVKATSADSSFSTQSYTIAINDVSEHAATAPVDTNSAANAVNENAAAGTTVGITAFSSDADTTNNAITYSLTDSAGGLFQINASTGVVTTLGAINRETTGASVSITVKATSADGSFDTEDFTIAIADVDEFNVGAPTDANTTANAVNENAAVGTVVGVTASASDADATNNTITYSLSSNPGGLFQINASTGVVTTLAAINRETVGASTSITVLATSSDGSTASQAFTIAINDVDEFDVATPADTNTTANSVNENVAAGTVVGITAAASDADATNNTITYSLTDNAGGLFQINASTGVVTTLGAINFETTGASKNITVLATSADGSTSSQTFSIAINNVNEAVVVSGATANATQISFTASDVDAGDTLSIATPFNTAFPGAVNNGSATTLTVAEQASLTSGTLSVRDAAGLTASVMGVALGTSAANTISAPIAGGANALYGFGGNDSMTGSTAADVLTGGAGNDAMTGGTGVDTFYVDSGTDTISDLGNGGADVVVVSTGASVTATATVAWTATAATANNGTATVTSAGFNVDVAAASGANGWTITGSGSTSMTLTGSAKADTITGGNSADTISGGAGNDTINGGTGADSIWGGDGADTINTGAADDNVQDRIHFTATSEYGDTITNFDATGSSSQVDLVRFTSALNTAFDDVTDNDSIAWVSGSNSAATGAAANLASAEALFLGGTSGEGVTGANLGNATSVAAAFNAEFTITGSGDALLVINDTDGNKFAIWQYVEAGTSEIQAAELTLIGTFTANAAATSGHFAFA
jgi:Ca2+-binding RTX toxin-like protein